MAPLEGGGGRLGPKLFGLSLKVGTFFRARPGPMTTHGPLQPAIAAASSTSHATWQGPDLSAAIPLVRGLRRRRVLTAATTAKAALAKRRQASAVNLDGLSVLRSGSGKQKTQLRYRIQFDELFAWVSRKKLKV